MRARRSLWLVGVASLLGLATGCPPPPVARPYAPPSAAELHAALKAREAHVHSLHAETKVDQLGPRGQRAKVRVSMLVARGGKLRLEAESPLGGPLATLTSDGVEFQLLDVRSNRFLVGPARACNLARLLQVELDPADVVSVLLGSAPLAGEPAEVAWDPGHGGREILILRTAQGEEKLWLSSRDRRWDPVEGEQRDARGKIVWRLRHEEFADHGDVRLPARTTVEEPPHHTDVLVKFRSQEPNVEPPPGAFHLDTPAGIAAELVTCTSP